MKYKELETALENIWYKITKQSSCGSFKWIKDHEWNYTKVQIRHDQRMQLEGENFGVVFYIDKCTLKVDEDCVSIVSDKNETVFIQFFNFDKIIWKQDNKK